jgi:hypothetical protein
MQAAVGIFLLLVPVIEEKLWQLAAAHCTVCK